MTPYSLPILALLLNAGSPASATTWTATPQTLASVLNSVRTGDVVTLTGGSYATLFLNNSQCPNSKPSCVVPDNLIFKAQNSATPPVLASVDARRVNGLTLDGLHIQAPFDAASGHSILAVSFNDVKGANILNCDIADQTRDISKVDQAINIRDSSNVRILGNTIHDVRRGIAILTSANAAKRPNLTTGITVSGNEFVRIRIDGIDINGADNLLISGNYLHDFRPQVFLTNGKPDHDHSDYIQLYSIPGANGQRLHWPQLHTSNVTIVDNIMVKGTSDSIGTQGIFARSNGAANEQTYTNFTIMNNLIFERNGGHGIIFDGLNGATISGNTVIGQPNAKFAIKIEQTRTSNIILKNNVADRYGLNGKYYSSPTNIIAEPIGHPEIYTTLFINYPATTVTTSLKLADLIRDLSAKTPGLLNGSGEGSIAFVSNVVTAHWNTYPVIKP